MPDFSRERLVEFCTTPQLIDGKTVLICSSKILKYPLNQIFIIKIRK